MRQGNWPIKRILKTIPFVFILLTCFACAEKQQEGEGAEVVQQNLNPNGDSELAILMRNMYEEAAQLKEQLARGEEPHFSVEHEKILSARATEPEKVASPEFKAFAGVYLQNIKNLQKAKTNELPGLYNELVENCMSCHQLLCPGPMVKIKKLRVTQK